MVMALLALGALVACGGDEAVDAEAQAEQARVDSLLSIPLPSLDSVPVADTATTVIVP